jgi:hypothetical protein
MRNWDIKHCKMDTADHKPYRMVRVKARIETDERSAASRRRSVIPQE